MSVSLHRRPVTRTAAAALVGLAIAGVALAAPAEAAPSKPISASGILRANQSATIATGTATSVGVCLRLAAPGGRARVLIAMRAGFPMTVTITSTNQQCTRIRPQGSVTLRNYGPSTVRYLVSSSVVFPG